MSAFTELAESLKKPIPRVIEKAKAHAVLESADERGNAEARKRAAGHCEIHVVGEAPCRKRDQHTHHMIAGRGKRGKGESANAGRKQRACNDHHRAIHHSLIRRIGDVMPHYTDKYERIYA